MARGAGDMPTSEDDLTARKALVRNEQLKARTTYLNGVAVAVFAIGALAPVAGAISAAITPSAAASALGVVCVLISFALHSLATRSLEGLRP